MVISVFVGPSIPLQDARAILPNAIYQPPAEQGDLLASVARDGTEVIGLIDGTFHQNLSVWHNEVCYLLSRGVTIFGSSSMGALRAVETAKFGAVGVGRIFEWYRDGLITADDEVALAHADAEHGFEPLSLPLVNLRATLSAIVDRGAMSEAAAEEVIRQTRETYYPHRTAERIVRHATEALGPDDLEALRAALERGYVDQKRLDAEELLTRLRDVVAGRKPRPLPPRFHFAGSASFDTLYNLDREIEAGDGVRVTMQSVAEYVALHDVKFDETRREALHRDLVIFLAVLLGLRPTPEDVSAEREILMTHLGLHNHDELLEWCRSNDASEQDFRELVVQETLCRRLRRWALSSRSFDRGARSLTDHLRLHGAYRQWRDKAVASEEVFAAYRYEPEYVPVDEADPALLAVAHAETVGVEIEGDAFIWAEMNGFDEAHGLANALRKAFVTSDVQRRVEQIAKLLETE